MSHWSAVLAGEEMTPEQKRNQAKKRKQKLLDAKPILGMAHYVMGDLAVVKLQVIKITKRSVTMKTISGRGTISLTTNNGQPIEDVIKIELLPCSLVPTITFDGKTKEIPQGTECGF